MNLFDIQTVNYKNRVRNLESESSGVVYSAKFFPVFEENQQEKILKPLSKTKPLLTPLFSYSEVYWSYLLNKYIDSTTPIYQLAYCKGLSKEQPKYNDKGCLVENILQDGENMINILELFRKYPDTNVNIDDYINFCEIQYDYSNILRSTFFTERKDLGSQLAEQILAAILRRDENYHYENVSLIEKDGQIMKLAPMIDFEFSGMFLFPDVQNYHRGKNSIYDEGMLPIFHYNDELSYEENYAIFMDRLKKW